MIWAAVPGRGMVGAIRMLLALLLLLTPVAARAATMLTVTDLHFDPMQDPSLTDALAAQPVAQWPDILDRAAGSTLGRFGSDAGWRLVRATLDEMRVVEPHPAAILALGDFLAHHFRALFEGAARDHSDAAYRAFVAKTLAFVAQEMQRRFPGVPVLPAVGNNDEDCGDYALEPGGPFLADTLPTARRLLGPLADPAVDATWRATGSYAVQLAPGLRVVSIDTVLFSRNYRNACGGPGGDPARATMEFLVGALDSAREAGDKVWLLYHIPPGADAYATLHRGACPDRTVPMWPDATTRGFEAVMQRYASTVAASFAGHTHMDEFRLIGADGFALVTPAVSPIFGQNPAFGDYTYEPDGRLADRTIWYLTNLADSAPIWRAEYAFDAAWGLDGLDARTLATLDSRIGVNAEDQARWRDYFSVSRPAMWQAQAGEPVPSPATMRVHACTEHTVDPAAFRACACQGNRP